MYKEHLALNDLKWFICHKSKANQTIRLYMHAGRIFTAGSPAGTKVPVGSLGRASMMLEDPKLVRTPRTSLTRRFCALF